MAPSALQRIHTVLFDKPLQRIHQLAQMGDGGTAHALTAKQAVRLRPLPQDRFDGSRLARVHELGDGMQIQRLVAVLHKKAVARRDFSTRLE